MFQASLITYDILGHDMSQENQPTLKDIQAEFDRMSQSQQRTLEAIEKLRSDEKARQKFESQQPSSQEEKK